MKTRLKNRVLVVVNEKAKTNVFSLCLEERLIKKIELKLTVGLDSTIACIASWCRNKTINII
jgi:hypothetical protein